MRLLVVLFVCVSCWTSAVRAEDLTSRTFTERVAQAVAARLPASTVGIAGDLALSMKWPDGAEASLSISNLYHDYKSNPARLGAIVDAYVAGLTETLPAATAKVDRARIVPVIKDRQWLDESRRLLKTGEDFLFEDFNKELVIIFAEDSAKRTRYLLSTEGIGIDRKELRKLAVDNLSRILPKIEMRQHDDVFFMISAGGDYEASLLLFDGIWSGDQIKVNGDIVVAVPAKDVLLITGSRNRKGLEVIRKMAAEFAKQERYRLIDTLFVYRDGKFARFGRK